MLWFWVTAKTRKERKGVRVVRAKVRVRAGFGD